MKRNKRKRGRVQAAVVNVNVYWSVAELLLAGLAHSLVNCNLRCLPAF